MELNPNEHYLVWQERRADALRDTEQWRLRKSVRRHSGSPGWVQRLRLRLGRRRHVGPQEPVGEIRREPRQPASSPTG